MQIDTDKRLEWLRALRRFKHGIKVREKLGVLQTICDQVGAKREGDVWNAPVWGHDRWITLLYTSIKNNEYPLELLTAFAETAEVTFLNPRNQPSVKGMVSAVDNVCREQSIPLRKRFGVFK